MFSLSVCNIILIVSAVISAVYILYTSIKNKAVPESISASLSKYKKWIWTAFMEIAAFGECPALLEVLPTSLQFVGFLTSTCMALTGAIPLIKIDKNIVHNILGISTGVLSQICAGILNPVVLSSWVIMPFFKKKRTFVAEIICYANTIAAVLINNI